MGTRPVIAVVDDDTVFVEMVRDFLGSEGYDTIAIEQASVAVDAIMHARPALILLDIRMDVANSGAEILVALRANPAVAAIPVIVCTADQQFLRNQAGFFRTYNAGFVSKPFDLDVLLDAIRRAMNDDSTAVPD